MNNSNKCNAMIFHQYFSNHDTFSIIYIHLQIYGLSESEGIILFLNSILFRLAYFDSIQTFLYRLIEQAKEKKK